MTNEEYPGIPDRIGDYYLTDFDKNLMTIIKKLEERIMVLELSSPYRKIRDDEAGEEYWEHG